MVWLCRMFMLCLLYPSAPAMAQTQAGGGFSDEVMQAEVVWMMEVVQEALKSVASQADVDVMVKVYKAVKPLKETNISKWQAIENAPLSEKEKLVREVADLKPGESFVTSALRVDMALQAIDPQRVAQVKAEYQAAVQQSQIIEEQLESMPKESADTVRNSMKTSLMAMERVSNYPAEDLQVITANQQILEDVGRLFENP